MNGDRDVPLLGGKGRCPSGPAECWNHGMASAINLIPCRQIDDVAVLHLFRGFFQCSLQRVRVA